MKKKIVALALVFCLSLAIGVGGTLAYLTATTGTVTNTFTVGNVSFTGAGLDEADVDEYGVKEYKEDGKTLKDRVTENKYKLVPGHTYVKDPTIHMSSTTEECYLFVTVENGISDIETTESGKTIAEQMAAKGWKEVKNTSGTVVAYVYYGTTTKDGVTTVNTARAKVGASEDVVVFESFTLADNANVGAEIEVTVDQTTQKVNKYADGQAEITIKAYAIQAEGFTADTTDFELWEEFKVS